MVLKDFEITAFSEGAENIKINKAVQLDWQHVTLRCLPQCDRQCVSDPHPTAASQL
jgi:hypothetical protein